MEFEVEDLPTVAGFVAAGLGVAVLPAAELFRQHVLRRASAGELAPAR